MSTNVDDIGQRHRHLGAVGMDRYLEFRRRSFWIVVRDEIYDHWRHIYSIESNLCWRYLQRLPSTHSDLVRDVRHATVFPSQARLAFSSILPRTRVDRYR